MKLVIKRNEFTNALSAASAITPTKAVRPILRNCLLNVDANGTIEIDATDLEIGLRTTMKAESVEKPETVCIPCSMIAGLLKECKEDFVTLETTGAKALLIIGRDKYELLGQLPEDFPTVQGSGKDENYMIVNPDDLAEMLDRVVYAAAREKGRYAINGVFLCASGKNIEMVATDGRRLAIAKAKLQNEADLKDGVILPLKMIMEMRRLCDTVESNANVKLALRGRQFIAETITQTLSSLIVEGIFPKYQTVLSNNLDKEVKIKRETLIQALRKAVLLTSEETKTVTLSFNLGICLIEARSPSKGQANVSIECDYAGSEVTIGFNPQYLSDVLKVLTSEIVNLELQDGTKPGVLRATNFIYVLMPVNPKE